MHLEQRVRADHPLRAIGTLVDEALASLDGRFGEIYSEVCRPLTLPEQLLRAMLLQAFSSVRSERQLMEQLDFNLLFRWFVGFGIDDPVWDASTFSQNHDRLLDGSVAAAFLSAVLAIPCVQRRLSQDHFRVDGTLIQAWAERGQGPRRAKLGGVASGGVDEELPAQGRGHATQPSRAARGRAQR